MDEFRRYAPEREAVDRVEAFTAHHQKPVLFGPAFQDRLHNRPLLLADCALELQQCQLLLRLLECFGRTRFHVLNFFLNVPLGPGMTGCARNGARSAAISTTYSAVTRGGSTSGSVAIQFIAQRPYFDPSVATSAFMLRVLSIEFPSKSNRQTETGCDIPQATFLRGLRV